MNMPILYSLRQCPYAMRARIALLLAKQTVYLRPIVMSNKPAEMLQASPKATVPVLIVKADDDSIQVIDESLDIMVWALRQNDPLNLLYKESPENLTQMLELIEYSDTEFVSRLKKYKAASRYRDENLESIRKDCEPFLAELENRLTIHDYFMGDTLSLADYALLPFIRQFSRVERQWFHQTPYENLQEWLKHHYANPLYSKAMTKHPLWLNSGEEVLLA